MKGRKHENYSMEIRREKEENREWINQEKHN